MICPDKQLDMWEYCDNSVILANADWYYTKQQTEELIDSVSGMNPTEVQDMINRSIHSKADKTYVDEQDAELSNSIRAINSNMAQRYTKTETNNLLDMKVDKSTYSAYTATTNEAIDNKQDQLISGTNIRTINGESILGSGDLVIQGGGDITSGEVQTMIDEAVSGKQDTLIAGDNITINNNVISSTASGDVTSAQVETMITTSISGKADTTAVTQDIATATADMATQTWVQNQGYLTEHQSLSAYSTTDEMNQAISAATDDMATETWVGNQGYITGVDLSNYATLQDIPTSNSALTNDAGYITSAALNGYATEDYVTAATDDMATETWVGEQGFLTEHQSLSAYSTTAEMNEAISASTSGKADTTAVTQDIATATNDMATQTWVQNQGYLTEHQSLSAYSTTQEMNDAITAATDDMATETWVNQQGFLTEHQSLSAYSTTAEMNQAISAATSGKVDTSTYTAYTSATDTALQGKQPTLVSGTNIKTINNESILGSGNITVQGSGNPTVEVTQAEYDALVSAGTVSADTYYIITDAEAIDLVNYYTKSETSGATQISTALSGKQDTLIAGDNITISGNVISAEGGGGASYQAGRGIDITNDTISISLPISAGTGTNSLAFGYADASLQQYIPKASGEFSLAGGSGCSALTSNSVALGYLNKAAGGISAYGNFAQGYGTTASGNRCHSEGLGTSSTADASHSEGNNTTASGNYSHSEGEEVKATNVAEHSQGRYNVSNKANNTWGDSGNTLFSVGNGTADNARHNAFEIRQNGDIYCNNGTSDVKLQDYIQFKIAKLSQSEYDALVQAGTVDASTVYFITNSNS